MNKIVESVERAFLIDRTPSRGFYCQAPIAASQIAHFAKLILKTSVYSKTRGSHRMSRQRKFRGIFIQVKYKKLAKIEKETFKQRTIDIRNHQEKETSKEGNIEIKKHQKKETSEIGRI